MAAMEAGERERHLAEAAATRVRWCSRTGALERGRSVGSTGRRTPERHQQVEAAGTAVGGVGIAEVESREEKGDRGSERKHHRMS